MNIMWTEFKYLDKSTNHSSRTKMIKNIVGKVHYIKYFCTYKKEKKYYDLSNKNIRYLNIGKIPKIRGVVFFIKIFFLNIYWCLFKNPDIVMMDVHLIKISLLSVFLNKLFK